MGSTGLSSSAPSDAAAAAPADVIVGIGCYNDAATIASAARAAAEGLQRLGRPGRIVVADGGSTDQAVQRAQEAAGSASALTVVEYARPAVDVLRAPYHGLEGRPAAIRAVLREALSGGAAACLFFDGKLTSATGEWVAHLLTPVLASSHDYVAPYYARHVFEGALTRSVVYPVFRALYGVRLRQPATGEFACSPQFGQHAMDQPFWEVDEAQTAIDLWLASAAVTGRLRVCEAAAGVRTHAAGPDAPDLTTTVAQVIGGLFSDIEARADTWHRVRSSTGIPCAGAPSAVEPAAPPVDVNQMIDAFRLGYRALRDEWAWILQPRTILRLKRLAEARSDQLSMGDEQWAEIVFDFALAHRARTMPRDHLLGCFTPLYLAWLAGFITEVRGGAVDAEQRLERLCVTFEMKKPYLIAGWRWPERFRA
jgi:hypothetical protein